MRWQKVTLIGVGLLGGSLGLALRKRGLAGKVCGYVRRESSIAECVQAGAVHGATMDLAEAVRDADLIVLCTPLLRMGELALQIAPNVRKGALITDVGSVKGPVVSELEPIFAAKGATFIGSHPMAGSEKMGVSAARADLFLNAACVVTPTKSSVMERVEETETVWREVGGRVIRLDPETHDLLVARSSHLPHVLAAQLATFVLDPKGAPEQSKLCANGFRDSTRIAAGSPEMWRDIVVMNRKQVLDALERFSEGIAAFRELLEQNDPGTLEGYFKRAKELRDEWTGRCASSSPE
jgi:prephenate dehydrogenase